VARFLRTADFELHKGGGAGAAADDLAARLNPPIVPLDKCLAMCAASAGTIIGKNGTRCNSYVIFNILLRTKKLLF
jgi:hypothetical protein